MRLASVDEPIPAPVRFVLATFQYPSQPSSHETIPASNPLVMHRWKSTSHSRSVRFSLGMISFQLRPHPVLHLFAALLLGHFMSRSKEYSRQSKPPDLPAATIHTDRIAFTAAARSAGRCYGLVVLGPLLSTPHRCSTVADQ